MENEKVIYAIKIDGDWFINRYGALWHTTSMPLAYAQAEACTDHFKKPCRVVDLDVWWHNKQREKLADGR